MKDRDQKFDTASTAASSAGDRKPRRPSVDGTKMLYTAQRAPEVSVAECLGSRSNSAVIGTRGSTKSSPQSPVEVFASSEDQRYYQLRVRTTDQAGFLFRFCELLGRQPFEILSCLQETDGGVKSLRFLLRAPPDKGKAASALQQLYKECEDFLRQCEETDPPKPTDPRTLERLCVNPDLLSVASFCEVPGESPEEFRYHLELEGINQAGLLAWISLVFFRSGLNICHLDITSPNNTVVGTFTLSTRSATAEQVLRMHLDLPYVSSVSPVNSAKCSPVLSSAKDPLQPPDLLLSPDFCSSKDSAAQADAAWNVEPPLTAPSSSEHPKVEAAGDDVPVDLTTRQRRIPFANGDFYSGHCGRFPEGERLHGYGCYTYSSGTHSSYRQYKGDWCQGRKHGHGVLLYQTGGSYVGQWLQNHRHGRGALLDYGTLASGGAAATNTMPTFFYEGEWVDDQMHGLGAEERPAHFFFGSFHPEADDGKLEAGTRRGVEVQLDNNMRVSSCEAIDGDSRVPLLDRLGDEIEQLYAEAEACTAETTGDDPALPRSKTTNVLSSVQTSTTSSPRPALASRMRSKTTNVLSSVQTSTISSPRPALASQMSTASKQTSGPASWMPSPNRAAAGDVAYASPSTSWMASPRNAVGSAANNSPRQAGGARLQHWLASPRTRQPQQSVIEEPTFLSSLGDSATGEETRTRSGSGGLYEAPPRPVQHRAPGMCSARGSGSAPASPVGGSRNLSSIEEEISFQLVETDGSTNKKVAQISRGGAGGVADFGLSPESSLGLEFEMEIHEGSGFTPPGVAAQPKSRKPFLSSPAPDRQPKPASPSGLASEGDDDIAVNVSGVRSPSRLRASTVADMPQASRGGSKSSAAQAACWDVGSDASGAERRALTPERGTTRSRRPILCPMLWSEDELAAFICCIGIGRDIAQRVRGRPIRGADQLLRMSNTDWARHFGFSALVQCLVLRRALKRFLELDRWENSVQGRRMQDTTDDPMLREFLVPITAFAKAEEISQGGFGMVYRGVLQLDKPVGKLEANKPYRCAAKEMKGDRSVRLHELLKEGRIMASLTHPNICTFLGICVKEHVRGGKQYILSELMDCSLFDLIHQPGQVRWNGTLSLMVVLRLFEQICAGIGYLHSRKLVHADLKSSNVLIDHTTSAELVPKICDFGHVAVRSHPAPHRQCGTPHWAAPEALRGEAVAPAADMFSCGVMLWEALAQRVPHRDLSFAQVLGAVGWAGWVPDEEQLVSEVPQELCEILKRCHSFAQEKRPTASEVRSELRQLRRHAKAEAVGMLFGFLGVSGCWPSREGDEFRSKS